jgi:hypothetical protein
MATALGVGTLATGPATEQANLFREFLNQNPLAKVLLAIYAAHHFSANSRHNELMAKLDAQAQSRQQ